MLQYVPEELKTLKLCLAALRQDEDDAFVILAVPKALQTQVKELLDKGVDPGDLPDDDASSSPSFYFLPGSDAAFANKDECDEITDNADVLVKTKPKTFEGYSNRGKAFQVKGDIPKALADYDKALALKADDPVLLFNRGFIRHSSVSAYFDGDGPAGREAEVAELMQNAVADYTASEVLAHHPWTTSLKGQALHILGVFVHAANYGDDPGKFSLRCFDEGATACMEAIEEMRLRGASSAVS
jgi:tetratricopeptide (TPR) repeat protein